MDLMYMYAISSIAFFHHTSEMYRQKANTEKSQMGLQGVEIFTNSSASHHELRKLDKRLSLILEATRKSGGIYIYANLKGLSI